MTAWVRGLTLALGPAVLVGVALLGEAAPARAQASADICELAVPAGSSVSALNGGSLGSLSESVSAIDCDDDYYLVSWGDGVGLVRHAHIGNKRVGKGARPDCTGDSTSVGCETLRAIGSKVEEWRRRYGSRPPKKN
jgi:hypothetical protein